MNKIFRNIEKYEIIYPDVDGATVSDDIIFTRAAMTELVNFLEENTRANNKDERNIRLFVESTTEYAKRYSISLIGTASITERDRVFELHKLKVVIDSKSLFYFMGVIIDFINKNSGRGFVFIDTYKETFIIPSEQVEEKSNKNILRNKIFC